MHINIYKHTYIYIYKRIYIFSLFIFHNSSHGQHGCIVPFKSGITSKNKDCILCFVRFGNIQSKTATTNIGRMSHISKRCRIIAPEPLNPPRQQHVERFRGTATRRNTLLHQAARHTSTLLHRAARDISPRTPRAQRD